MESSIERRQKIIEIIGAIAAIVIIASLFIQAISFLIVPSVILLAVLFLFSIYKNIFSNGPVEVVNQKLTNADNSSKIHPLLTTVVATTLVALALFIIGPFISLVFFILVLGVSGV